MAGIPKGDSESFGSSESSGSTETKLIFGDARRLILPVLSPGEYSSLEASPAEEPYEVGHYSVDGGRNFHADQSQMKYLSMPPAPQVLQMDLNKNYEQTIHEELCYESRIDNILRWILSNQDEVKRKFPSANPLRAFNVDFVTSRGTLSKVLCTPYKTKDDWLICASKFKGTIYLATYLTDSEKESDLNSTEKDIMMTTWGFKFEQYMVSDLPSGKPDTDRPLNEREKFFVTVTRRVNGDSLLFSAETDAMDLRWKGPDNSTKRYVELKTSIIPCSKRQRLRFHKSKLLSWWAQSYIAGIPRIICGYRDEEGFVRYIRSFDTSGIPALAQGMWNPAVALKFLEIFLAFVKKCVVKDDPNIMYTFYWKPGADIIGKELESPSENPVLPSWYTSACVM